MNDNPLLGPRDTFIVDNLGLVHDTARTYRNHTEYDDIISEGTIGLIYAYDRYSDPTRKFSTYAVPYIRGYIRNYFRTRSGLFSAPRRTVALARRIAELGLKDNPPETIAQELGVKTTSAHRALICLAAGTAASIDEQDPEDSMPLVCDDDTNAIVDEFMTRLTARQAEVVRLLMGGYTQSDVGRRLGITRQGVKRTVEMVAIKYLKEVA